MNERELSFHGARGVSLAGVLSVPDDAGSPVPGVLLCQGLSGVKHLVLPEIAERFAAHGLASLRFDYAGYGESDGERGWIDPRARVGDAAHALELLAADSAVDAALLGAYGHSYGGPVAIALAARDRRDRRDLPVQPGVQGPVRGAEAQPGRQQRDRRGR